MPGTGNLTTSMNSSAAKVTGGESATTNLLNQNSTQQQSVNTCPYSHRELRSLHIIKKTLCIRWTALKKKNHNQSKCRVVDPSPNGYIYKIILQLRLREH